jgi:hypothetical protein
MWAESVPYRRPFNIVDGITKVSESPTPHNRRRGCNLGRPKSYAALRSCRYANARARNCLLIEAPDSSGTAFGPASLSTTSLKC